jgi:hypothetical protein
MNTEALFLYLILLVGLVLCSFLGGNYNKESFTGNFNGKFTVNENNKNNNNSNNNNNSSDNINTNYTNYDNYNHYSGSSSQLTNGATFYGENGGSVKVNMQSDGKPKLIVSLSKGYDPMILTTNKNDHNTFSITITKTKETFDNTDKKVNLKFYGPNDVTAVVINYQGQQAIKINTKTGSYIYTLNNPTPTAMNKSITSLFNSNYSTYNNTPSSYFGSTGVNGANINNSNKAYNDLKSQQTQNTHTPTRSYNYSNSLPQGIPKNMIPPGKEHLYILKSEIVPPVCPACPAASTIPRQEQCPPCPACARCPEPSFECKKVPNYNAINNEFLPVPVLSNFSSFGM